MSDFHPDSDLRPYAGERPVDRPVLTLGPFGPWRATVTVTPVDLRGAGGWQFRVHAAWEGPANAGSPIAGDDRRQASAELYVPDQELARALALRAEDELRLPRVPDLLALLRALKRR